MLSLLCFLLSVFWHVSASPPLKLVCHYWTTRSPPYNRLTSGFRTGDVRPALCTDLVYGDLEVVVKSGRLDVLWTATHNEELRQLLEFKMYHPHVRFHLGLLISDRTTKKMAPMMSGVTRRTNLFQFLNDHQLQGIFIRLTPEMLQEITQRRDLHTLLKVIRSTKKSPDEDFSEPDDRLKVTATVPNVMLGYPQRALTALLSEMDEVEVELYPAPWDVVPGGTLQHPGILFAEAQHGESPLLEENLLQRQLSRLETPANQTLLALPTYAVTTGIYNSNSYWPGSRSDGSPGHPGNQTRLQGVLSYPEVCNLLQTKHWYKKWDWTYRATYAIGRHNYHWEWIAFEDERRMVDKARIVSLTKLAGMSISPLSMDDHSGAGCGHGPFPLLQAAFQGLGHGSVSYWDLQDKRKLPSMSVHPTQTAEGSDISFLCLLRPDVKRKEKATLQAVTLRKYSDKERGKESIVYVWESGTFKKAPPPYWTIQVDQGSSPQLPVQVRSEVKGAECRDSGTYRCEMTFSDPDPRPTEIKEVHVTEKVKVQVQAKPSTIDMDIAPTDAEVKLHGVTIVQVYAGENYTATCTWKSGDANATWSWSMGFEDEHGTWNSIEHWYDEGNERVDVFPMANDPCRRVEYQSHVTFHVEQKMQRNMIVCSAGRTRAMRNLYVTTRTVPPPHLPVFSMWKVVLKAVAATVLIGAAIFITVWVCLIYRFGLCPNRSHLTSLDKEKAIIQSLRRRKFSDVWNYI